MQDFWFATMVFNTFPSQGYKSMLRSLKLQVMLDHASSLNQGVVCARQHCFGFLERIDLRSPRLFTSLVIGQQPITFSMQVRNVLLCSHKLLFRSTLGISILDDVRFKSCLCTCLFLNGQSICSTFVCRICNHLLILFLCIFFIEFHLLDLLC